MSKFYLSPSEKGAIGRHGGASVSLPNLPEWLTPIPPSERYEMTAPRRKMPITRDATLEDLAQLDADLI